MPQAGNRKFVALLCVLGASLIVALVLAGVTIWGKPEAVGASVGPIALMWGGVAAMVGSTFNAANAAEHMSDAKVEVATVAAATPPTP